MRFPTEMAAFQGVYLNFEQLRDKITVCNLHYRSFEIFEDEEDNVVQSTECPCQLQNSKLNYKYCSFK